jgi:hypothetical protein
MSIIDVDGLWCAVTDAELKSVVKSLRKDIIVESGCWNPHLDTVCCCSMEATSASSNDSYPSSHSVCSLINHIKEDALTSKLMKVCLRNCAAMHGITFSRLNTMKPGKNRRCYVDDVTIMHIQLFH